MGKTKGWRTLMPVCNPADFSGRLATLEANMPVKPTEATCMQFGRRIPLRKSMVDQTVDQAIQRVYETYGSNLAQFLAIIQMERTRQAHESPEMRRDDPRQGRNARSASDQAR